MISTSGANDASDGLARQQAGARWWSIDIHAHSPESFDYGGTEGHANEALKPSFKEWIRAYIDAGLDGLVVTDHNSHAGIDQARQALAELRRESPELPPFVIFPGVELTVTGGTHILGIFDPTCDAEVVNRVLTLCEFTGTRGHSDGTANKTVLDAAAVIVTQGGICVPAHADQFRGVFKIDSRDLEALIASESILAVEVVDDGNVGEAERVGWVPVLGSDAPHLTTDGCPDEVVAKAPGTHTTLIKAETLDLEGFRLALTDPIHSVRRSRRGDIDPNNTGHGHIDRIWVEHDGVTEDYRFGPWLNCLIGGRGVGKSTLVELLRLALGRSHELAGSVAVDLKRFQPSADPSERWWDGKTRIVVEYTKDDRLLRVTWSGDEPHKSVLEVLEGGTWQAQAGRVFDRVPIRVFSQKQIYELATSPRSFLTILDDMPPIQKSEWDIEYEELQLKFKGERNKLRQLLAEADKSDRIRGQLEEVQGRLHRLAELQSTPQYDELTATEARIRDATTAEDQAESIEQNLGTHASELRGLVTDVLQVTDYADRATSFTIAADLLEQAATALATARASWQSEATSASWQARVEELNAWLAEQSGAFHADAEQTQADRQREAELQAELREVESSAERRQEQDAAIAQLMQELSSKRSELFGRRQEFARQLNATATHTRVNVHEQGDVATIGAGLRALLNCPESFESAFGQDGIAASLLKQQPKDPRFPNEVDEFRAALVELVERGADSEIGLSLKVDARFYSRLAAADTFDLVTNIMLWFPEDLIAVQYRQTEGGNFTPVDQGSPGQKTAALLTVILQMGTDPLLLDQPEDDLENKLIKQLAVETLKNIKTRRQIIVSTHNANIVVTSAAENILVLEHGESLPKIETEGTLQVRAVKANVCVILEGGEDAIKTRYRRLIGPTDT
ncbi:AAA family ATPase [Kribbella sp. NBC_01510]|uniref:TrlF family AAA-like ATPase n=1 Tax=Kribbella sp. NBC_01510 TaxID=2903581 RepID=UPI00386E1137